MKPVEFNILRCTIHNEDDWKDHTTEDQKKLLNNVANDAYGLCDAPTDAQTALNAILDYLMPNHYVAVSENVEQTNTALVDRLLRRYSDKYNQDIRRRLKCK